MRRVSRYIDRLLGQRRPPSFVPTHDEAGAVRAAIVLRSARPEASLPRGEFIAELHDRLAEHLSRSAETEPEPVEPVNPADLTGRRRIVLIAASAAAGSAAIAVVADRAITRPAPPGGGTAGSTLDPNAGIWHTIMSGSDLPEGAVVHFDTGPVAGFAMRTAAGLSARSATCTHQGCRLSVDPPAARFACPCHRTFFALDGTVIHSQLRTRPRPLPAIPIRENDGNIQVLVPRPTGD